ncbi:15-cis-phytoene desaturase CrtI [Gloeobacter kilaueensis]|uniref:Phytoene dehydrogenase n=1 Tax=Gloeobacter kilaueensis (strain ATCC BAA-2537 / CCAP 1431/1 / ULC 316 / JS1) TaxID=1183438 RepID=U5QGM2_GLOK1|nr:phytoene desaturase family protein [Gloeobacter kilaueensis]AGY58081.1 phytoene dehydrogenase [Gloeobacter kilaueensis JS1]
MERKKAIIVGSGIGGLALGIRLQSLGFETTIFEKLDGPGGRAYVRRAAGFTFDMGPTVITVPHFIEELFALERDRPALDAPDFPASVLAENSRIRSGVSGGPATSRYVKIIPILPFYRIYFEDGAYFDYDGDPEHTREQIRALAPDDLEGYERFHRDARAIFQRGFLELGFTYFRDIPSMLRIAPDLVKLDAVRPLFSFVKRYFKSDKLRQVFSFEPLLIGGNPLAVPAIYAMIHFVEKTWGIHFAMGGTGALVQGFVRKFEELGGTIRYQSEVARIEVTGSGKDRRATAVLLANGSRYPADLVASNGDYVNTYLKLIDRPHRPSHPDVRLKLSRQSMSLLVIYFGFRADGLDLDLRHHNIILGPRYEELLKDIFSRKVLASDFSQYLHIPSITDPSLAPAGHHCAYTLVPVPHNGSGLDWSKITDPFVDTVLGFLDDRGYIPGLRERLVYKSCITPDYFEHTLNSWLGNGFGVEPVLWQSAYFRPHNKCGDISNFYLVGANAQPGGGTPAVMMSAKMTAREVARDFNLSFDSIESLAQPASPRAI